MQRPPVGTAALGVHGLLCLVLSWIPVQNPAVFPLPHPRPVPSFQPGTDSSAPTNCTCGFGLTSAGPSSLLQQAPQVNQRPPDKLCSAFRAHSEAGHLPTGSECQEKQPRLPEGSDTATVTELPAGEWKQPPHTNTVHLETGGVTGVWGTRLF